VNTCPYNKIVILLREVLVTHSTDRVLQDLIAGSINSYDK
jgi:hypothetical protein